jgi:hypothetical protein
VVVDETGEVPANARFVNALAMLVRPGWSPDARAVASDELGLAARELLALVEWKRAVDELRDLEGGDAGPPGA